MKAFKLIFLITVFILGSACTSSNTKNYTRGLASGKSEVFIVNKFEHPVEILLNTEYRGTFVADVSAITTATKFTMFGGLAGLAATTALNGKAGPFKRDCKGSISIWFYKDTEGRLKYYSKGDKAYGATCDLPKLGDMTELSQKGMDKCAGLDFNYNKVELDNINYLRELDFDNMSINAPVCNEHRPPKETELEFKDTLKLAILKSNGGNGNLHLQITMLKALKMNYYLTPMVNVREFIEVEF